MADKFEGECPIEGCTVRLNNGGALGTHLKFKHGLNDVGLRQFIVSEWKKSIREGSPLKLSVDKFKEMYLDAASDAVTSKLGGGDGEYIEDEPPKPIAASPKILAFVDSLGGAQYDVEVTREGSEVEGSVEMYRRRMPRTVRPQSIVVDPELYIYYDFVRSKGYKGSFSDFINESVKLFFRERGYIIGVMRLEHE